MAKYEHRNIKVQIGDLKDTQLSDQGCAGYHVVGFAVDGGSMYFVMERQISESGGKLLG